MKQLSITFVLFLASLPLSAQEVDFERDIAPIFESHCSHCHGEDEQESSLRLDRRAKMLSGGDLGLPTIVPGKPEKSYLIDVVKHLDPDVKMPPDEDRIPDDEIELLSRWIKEGAVWPGQMEAVAEEKSDHWSFQPVVRPSVPKIADQSNPVDAFLMAELAKQGLKFSEPADPRLLMRRVSLVLTGLPPKPKEMNEFLKAHGEDSDAAYVELVDRLLDSPHFGERWAQHWLDVIRWAETNGSESNMYRKNAWTYRDYVVRAFNEDKPYDQFIQEQLAGDTMGAGDATGFLVAGPHVPAGTVGFEPSAIRQARADRMDEILQTVGASVMGVTIGCARCHNHKFDPISITDYYSMSAIFQDVEFGGRYPELAADDPRVAKEQEFLPQLNSLRKELQKPGWGWIEDWTGYQEVRFPPKTVKALRFSFNGRFAMADEMEIFEASDERRNVALEKFGTTIRENSATLQEGKSATKLVNGVFGTKQWIARSPKESEERPWVEFRFAEPVTVDTIRISTNREDFLETDYLQGMHKVSYGEFKVAVQDDEGEWKPFSSTVSIKKRVEENEDRKALHDQIQSVIKEMQTHGRQPAFIARFIDPVDSFVFARGSPESPRDKVGPSAPKLLNGKLAVESDSDGPARRKAMADWIVDPVNPLTARVMANRLWHHTFGIGIVATPSDFGKAGAPPSHPKLIEWLAAEFVDPSSDGQSKPSTCSMKRMIRMFVLSKAFRQSSQPHDDGLAKDAGARMLWRFPPQRVDAEVIRDSILQASGCLDETVGGVGYRIHNVKKRYAQWNVVDNHGEETWRRMLYQERMRRVDDRMFTAFDFPDCGQIRAKRPVSTTPLQALNLMNSPFVIDQAKRIAERAKVDADSEKESVARCFELLLGRAPRAEELESCMTLAREEDLSLVCRALINSNEFAFLP